MALRYYPRVGEVLLCEYPECFAAPEMVKLRPVVVINPRIPCRDGLVTVVPLSTTAPSPALDHHVRIPTRLMQLRYQAETEYCWAKCDMVCTLATQRLSPVQGRRDRRTGKRSYESARLDLDHIQQVRLGVSAALGITGALFPPIVAAPAPSTAAVAPAAPPSGTAAA